MGNSPTNETPGGAAGKGKTKLLGHAALDAEEKLVLTWTADQRLAEFQKVNPNVDTKELETKLLYIDSMSVELNVTAEPSVLTTPSSVVPD